MPGEQAKETAEDAPRQRVKINLFIKGFFIYFSWDQSHLCSEACLKADCLCNSMIMILDTEFFDVNILCILGLEVWFEDSLLLHGIQLKRHYN